jgi:NADH dehydrogenase/NADH:ubiquinone oxidoreductase subunit G
MSEILVQIDGKAVKAKEGMTVLEAAQSTGKSIPTFFCIHCGLCVRYCAEVKQKNAVGFVDRGIRKEICFIPEIAAKECWDGKECLPLCPTEALQAAYVLTKSLISSAPSIDSTSKE